MSGSYDVRVFRVFVYEGTRGKTYRVRWEVAGQRWGETFKTAALADSFRADLLSASRKGEAFDLASGRPVAWQRTRLEVSWYSFACGYVDMKWASAAATYRRGIAEALTSVTPVLMAAGPARPDQRALRSALFRWSYNSRRREQDAPASDVADVLKWMERNSKPVSSLADPVVLRVALDTLSRKLDGQAAAPTVVNRKRAVLSNALEYAVELGLLSANPIGSIKWKAPRTSHRVDRRAVVNPIQARSLLRAVGETQRSGPQLVAFFGAMYFAALRPEEAVNLHERDLRIPGVGWGELILERARPDAGTYWTDTGKQRDERQLKHRARGEVRRVPCPPELTALLHDHLRRFGVGGEGRLFRGERSDELPSITYAKTWRRARMLAFTPEVVASPLARRPYDLRHAAVSTWLNGGVPATQVAEWAGHSVAVLHQVYAACLDGQESMARRRVSDALGYDYAYWPVLPLGDRSG